jgi:RHS repeat-associated protein
MLINGYLQNFARITCRNANIFRHIIFIYCVLYIFIFSIPAHADTTITRTLNLNVSLGESVLLVSLPSPPSNNPYGVNCYLAFGIIPNSGVYEWSGDGPGISKNLYFKWTLNNYGILGLKDRAEFTCKVEDESGQAIYTNYIFNFSLISSKNLGNPGGCAPNHPPSCEGNPIDAASGNKFLQETDYTGGSMSGISLVRYYNSMAYDNPLLGTPFGGWSYNWVPWLAFLNKELADKRILIQRADGRVYSFKKGADGPYTSDPDVRAKLILIGSPPYLIEGLLLTLEDDTVEQWDLIYDFSGGMVFRLNKSMTRAGQITQFSYDTATPMTPAAIIGPFGHRLKIEYGTSIDGATYATYTKLTVPGGGVFTYHHDMQGRLSKIVYPDNSLRSFVYENTSFPKALTGVVDEKGVRFATYGYDASGFAISTQHAGGAEKTTLDYNSGVTTVTDARGNAHSYHLTTQFGTNKTSSMTGAPVPNAGGASFTYDANGFIASRTDWNGSVTTYAHDARGNETSRTEASGTPQARTISTTWHETFHLPIRLVEPNRTTTFGYDAKGNLLTKTITSGASTRAYSYTYNALGQVLTAKDPMGRVTTYNYYTTADYPNGGLGNGAVKTIINALGQVTRFTGYDADGRPLTVVDPNGLVTTLTYDKRGRVTKQKEGALTTRYAYDAVGNVIKITSPDGSFLAFTYDAAHRLTKVADALGNRIGYALDAAGNRVKEKVYDPANALKRSRAYAYDSVDRLIQITDSANRKTNLVYDNEGNRTSVADPLRHTTSYSYDALNRMAESLDASGGKTTFGYDANDHLTAVIDPRGLRTSYAWNGMDDQRIIASPDTAKTVRTFDAAGNVLTSTDGRGKVTTFGYDALNRRTSATFADGTSVAYQYDQGANGIGRLTKITDATGSTSYVYDANGHVTQKTQVVGALTLVTSYGYDAGGRLSGVTFPSGKVVTYAYDAAGRVTSIASGAQTLVSGVTYQPFGGASGWTFGNDAAYARTFDLDERITALSLPASDNLSLTYDAAGRITKITDSAVATKTFIYDALDRLTRYAGGTLTQSYGYDADGNRISTSFKEGAATKTFVYAFAATNNRLASISGAWAESFRYDVAGNMLAHGTPSANYAFAYDARGRLAKSKLGALSRTYGVNGLGQRMMKADPITADNKTIFAYDEAGRLIGEYDATGTLVQETVWLGDLPVATIRPSGVFYIAPDHLGAPHQITNAAGQVVWLWDHDPFGNGAPTGSLVYNLRFPGQYFDAETGLSYNYFRDYDPKLGRYVQSDPIGLAGGVNSYAYSTGNPVSHYDIYGLDSITIISYKGGAGHIGFDVNGGPTFGYTNAASTFDLVLGTDVNGYLFKEDHEDRKVLEQYTINITGYQAGRALEYINKLRKDGGKYNLYSNNCTHVAANMLRDIGMKVPKVWTPDVLMMILNGRQRGSLPEIPGRRPPERRRVSDIRTAGRSAWPVLRQQPARAQIAWVSEERSLAYRAGQKNRSTIIRRDDLRAAFPRVRRYDRHTLARLAIFT